MRKPPPRLGKVQLEIMQILWKRKKATARQITQDLNESSVLAHSTIQTLLRKMEAKGAVGHVMEDRTFVFVPLVEQEEIVENVTSDLLTRVFQGSMYSLVAHLLQHETVDPSELRRLRELLDEETQKTEHTSQETERAK